MNLVLFSICYLLSIVIIMAIYTCLNKLKIHLNGFVEAMLQFIPPAGTAIFIVLAVAWLVYTLLIKSIYYFSRYF